MSEKCHTCRLGDGGMADGWVRRSVNVVYQIVHRNSAYCRWKNVPTNYSVCKKDRCIVISIWMKKTQAISSCKELCQCGKCLHKGPIMCQSRIFDSKIAYTAYIAIYCFEYSYSCLINFCLLKQLIRAMCQSMGQYFQPCVFIIFVCFKTQLRCIRTGPWLAFLSVYLLEILRLSDC